MNLVLKGGGIRGIAYTGALSELEKNKITDSIANVAGTSVGAIVGTLFSVGYSAAELRELMFGLRIEQFNDGEWFFLGGQKRLRKNYGWYKGEKMQFWLANLIKEKTGNGNLTFAQLHTLKQRNTKFKDLYITATNITKQRVEIFDWYTYPDMPIINAVKASTAVPLYFSAVFIDSVGNIIKQSTTDKQGDIMIDGGLLANYPLAIFDTNGINNNTLGLKLERPEQIDRYKASGDIAPYNSINSFNSYLAALYNLFIETLNRKGTYKEEQFRTVYISTSNLNPRVRTITLKQKELLYENGENAVRQFLKNK
ncbi:MAG: patatin-like phospholipase family protein [Taibaiella sp.]|nr:patatin-like phospholipase family protein [Taibaiella sp.]